MLMDRHRQGQHQIALVPQQVLLETHNHDGQAQQAAGHRRQQAEGLDQFPQIPQTAHHQLAAHGQHQHHQVQDPHGPGCGQEFLFQQLLQHLNTSRNSASTLIPLVSRRWSTSSARTICPFRRKITSSSNFSTSAIKWVEITTEASGL